MMKMRLYAGIKELEGTKLEARQFLINAGLTEVDGKWSSKYMIGELIDGTTGWIARCWVPEERIFDGKT
jgi:hypothetical protein